MALFLLDELLQVFVDCEWEFESESASMYSSFDELEMTASPSWERPLAIACLDTIYAEVGMRIMEC